MTYCLVLWNRRFAESRKHSQFYRHSDREPINCKDYTHPVLGTKEQAYKMVPILEFLERL